MNEDEATFVFTMLNAVIVCLPAGPNGTRSRNSITQTQGALSAILQGGGNDDLFFNGGSGTINYSDIEAIVDSRVTDDRLFHLPNTLGTASLQADANDPVLKSPVLRYLRATCFV